MFIFQTRQFFQTTVTIGPMKMFFLEHKTFEQISIVSVPESSPHMTIFYQSDSLLNMAYSENFPKGRVVATIVGLFDGSATSL